MVNPVIFRRVGILLCFVYCFSALAGFFAEDILCFLGQPADIAKTSARFAQVQLMGLRFSWLANSMNTCLSCTKRTLPGFLMSTSSSMTQLVLGILLIHPKLLGRSKGPCDVFDPWVRWERGQVGI